MIVKSLPPDITEILSKIVKVARSSLLSRVWAYSRAFLNDIRIMSPYRKEGDDPAPSHHVQSRCSLFGPLFKNPWETAHDPTLRDVAWMICQIFKKGDVTLTGTLSWMSKPTPTDFRCVLIPVQIDGVSGKFSQLAKSTGRR